MDVVAARSRRVRQPRQNGKYFVIPSPTGPAGSGRRRVIRQGAGRWAQNGPAAEARHSSTPVDERFGSHDQSPLWRTPAEYQPVPLGERAMNGRFSTAEGKLCRVLMRTSPGKRSGHGIRQPNALRALDH